MSLSFVHGNLFDGRFDALVNPVNCVGVMGAGLALQFKWRFPENFDAYRLACQDRRLQPGRVFLFRTGSSNPCFIVNFPTKLHFRNPSKLRYVENGLKDLRGRIPEAGIKSIAVPPLGCGLGGLRWDDVRPLLEKWLSDVPGCDATAFLPKNVLQETSAERIIR